MQVNPMRAHLAGWAALLAVLFGICFATGMAGTSENSNFPDCLCLESLSTSPYRIEWTNSSSQNDYWWNGELIHAHTYCFTIRVTRCLVDSPCCNAPLYKIELPVPLTCGRSLLGATFNSQRRTPNWSSDILSQDRRNLKITHLGLHPGNADGAVLCLTLGRACPRMLDFCWPQNGLQCTFALFNNDPWNCCPLVTLFGPPPPFPPNARSPPLPPPPRPPLMPALPPQPLPRPPRPPRNPPPSPIIGNPSPPPQPPSFVPRPPPLLTPLPPQAASPPAFPSPPASPLQQPTFPFRPPRSPRSSPPMPPLPQPGLVPIVPRLPITPPSFPAHPPELPPGAPMYPGSAYPQPPYPPGTLPPCTVRVLLLRLGSGGMMDAAACAAFAAVVTSLYGSTPDLPFECESWRNDSSLTGAVAVARGSVSAAVDASRAFDSSQGMAALRAVLGLECGDLTRMDIACTAYQPYTLSHVEPCSGEPRPPAPPVLPPAPPPPPRQPWPFCVCEKRQAAAAWVLSEPYWARSSASFGGGMHPAAAFCMDLIEYECSMLNPCCMQDVFKVELEVDAACHNEIQFVAVGRATSEHLVYSRPAFSTKPYAALRVSIHETSAGAHGLRVCVGVANGTACAAPGGLCRTGRPCHYAIFNSPEADGEFRCCPTGHLPSSAAG
uniref:Pherophorin domain-containing protein n=1 Tax=Chlamydomonas euryale TaxID=1486919 RepID=A0A7R9VHL3_9CHLO|mmetsp:Transcript_35874/g.106038  ORF Transcript_35874/g.106038 Transcript_35874/m.106038 type:complete len:664 (+) Transcript_35874:398-2389(+)